MLPPDPPPFPLSAGGAAGAALGATLGTLFGAALGLVLGAAWGAALGALLGAAPGFLLGAAPGAVLGAALGAMLGSGNPSRGPELAAGEGLGLGGELSGTICGLLFPPPDGEGLALPVLVVPPAGAMGETTASAPGTPSERRSGFT